MYFCLHRTNKGPFLGLPGLTSLNIELDYQLLITDGNPFVLGSDFVHQTGYNMPTKNLAF